MLRIESNKAFDVTAELPGMDDKNIEVKVANGNLTMRRSRRERSTARPPEHFSNAGIITGTRHSGYVLARNPEGALSDPKIGTRPIVSRKAAVPVALRPHFVHYVVLAYVPDNLEAEIGIRPDFGRRRMIDLEGLDLLAEIGGVSAYMDHIANA